MRRELTLTFESGGPLRDYLRRPIGHIPDWKNDRVTRVCVRAVWWIKWGGFWLRWCEGVEPEGQT